MATVPMKLVTLVAESVLADRLVIELGRLGASGWTITEARGDGSRGVRTGPLTGENIRLEAVVDAAVAERLLETLHRDYFPHFALVAWVSDVQVVRGEKYR